MYITLQNMAAKDKYISVVPLIREPPNAALFGQVRKVVRRRCLRGSCHRRCRCRSCCHSVLAMAAAADTLAFRPLCMLCIGAWIVARSFRSLAEWFQNSRRTNLEALLLVSPLASLRLYGIL